MYKNVLDNEYNILYHTRYCCEDKSITGNTDIKKHKYVSPWSKGNWYKQRERFTIKTPNIKWDDMFINGTEDPDVNYYWFNDLLCVLAFIDHSRSKNRQCVLMWDKYQKQYCCFVKDHRRIKNKT